MRTRQLLTATAAAALAAGCGSTVVAGVSTVTGVPGTTGSASSAPLAGTNGALNAPTGSSATGGGTATTGGGTTLSLTGGAATGATSTTGTSGQMSGGGASGTTAATGPGITPSTMYVGLEYSSDEGAGDKAIGAAGAAPSYDQRDVYNAVIKYANQNGGFAGRKLQPVFHNVSIADNRNTSDQAACADFTQDHKVFAMNGDTDVLRACAEKAGAVSLIGGNAVASTFQKFPHFIDQDFIRLDRQGPVTVNGLYRAGYFSGKLGLLTWDDPNYRYAMSYGYLPTLSSHGIKPLQVAYVAVPQQIGAVGDMSAAMSSVVTKFRSLGIDHVIIEDGPAGVWAGGGLTLEFMDQAKSQHYYPRYGQNGNNLPGSTILPADEQNQALAIMATDYSSRYDQGWRQNPARLKCFEIQAKAGLPVSTSNENDEVAAAEACDFVFLLQQVVNGISMVNSDAFVQGVAGLGTKFGTAFTYGTRFFPGRRDGPDSVRSAEYFSSCQCLKYNGAPYRPD